MLVVDSEGYAHDWPSTPQRIGGSYKPGSDLLLSVNFEQDSCPDAWAQIMLRIDDSTKEVLRSSVGYSSGNCMEADREWVHVSEERVDCEVAYTWTPLEESRRGTPYPVDGEIEVVVDHCMIEIIRDDSGGPPHIHEISFDGTYTAEGHWGGCR